MHLSTFFCATAALLLSASTVAHADTFNFTITGSGFTASGTLTGSADPFITNAFDITGATGTIVSPDNTPVGSIIGLAPTVTAVNSSTTSTDSTVTYNVDNVIYLDGTLGHNGGDSASFVDKKGVVLKDANGVLYNIFSNGGDQIADNPGTGVNSDAITFTVSRDTSPVPEPSSLALLGTGLLGAVATIRRRLTA